MRSKNINLEPKISFIVIVLNGMPFIEFALRAVYDQAHEIIIVEGAVSNCLFAANPDGSSVDGTVEAIRNFPDSKGKIRFVQGVWPEKLDMHNKALEYVTGDYIWIVDADEIYKRVDIERIKGLLAGDSSITRVDFITENFWKGFDYIFVSDRFFEEPHHTRRIFKYIPTAHFLTHRPPTLNCEDDRIITGHDTRKMGIYPYHYSYVFWSQVYQKVELYHRYGWGKQWGVDLDEWYRDFFCKWTPENRSDLEEKFPVWTGDDASRTEHFKGTHPEVMQSFVSSFARTKELNFPSVPEGETLSVVGHVEFQRQVLRAWRYIQLDSPLCKRQELMQVNVTSGTSFWNIHVALAFMASILRPKKYLEVGVRSGGSLVQVLHHAEPDEVFGIDMWGGNYAGMPNNLDFTKAQFEQYQKKTGSSCKLTFIKGNSHRELKRLISNRLKFALITIDGDHTRDGAWEDLEDAVSLLEDRGAVVFDDIIHESHKNLLTLIHRMKLKYPWFNILINTTQDNGCAILLKNIDHSELFKHAKSLSSSMNRVAGEDWTDQSKSLTQIDQHSLFASSIEEVLEKINPRKIIETGTFHGNGTTNIIASWLKKKESTSSGFYSIECNSDNLVIARENLSAEGLGDCVSLIYGLSVPRSILPSVDLIRERLVNNLDGNGLFVDHEKAVRTQKYFSETNYPGAPEDRLGFCLEKFNNAPDFVLLDSGGHMGNLEFNYLIKRLQSSCYIALDDINHVKHYRSYRQIRNDPRFTVEVSSDEKFGYCIARFDPHPEPKDGNPIHILWVRTDAIGDNVLSLPALSALKKIYPSSWVTVLCQDYVSDVYSACSFVNEVLTFDRLKAFVDIKYRRVTVERLQELNADICIAPVMSRHELTDIFALGSRATKRITFTGNDCNIKPLIRKQNNCLYTGLVSVVERGHQSEYGLYRKLLAAVGSSNPSLSPVVWHTEEDEVYAHEVFSQHELNPERTIVLFAGAQDAHRFSLAYGRALKSFCGEHQYAVIALGTSADREITCKNLDSVGLAYVDLLGRTTLRQTAAMMASCALALGAETGLAHVAASVGTPHVVLLGGGHFGRFFPYSSETVAVSIPLDCFGCDWNCRYDRCYCITEISSDVLIYALKAALSKTNGNPRLVLQGSSLWVPENNHPEWQVSITDNLDVPVDIILYERDGTVLSEHYPNSTFFENPGQLIDNTVDEERYAEFMAHYVLEEFNVSLLKNFCYSFKQLCNDKLSLKEFLRLNIHSLRGWFRRVQ